MSTPSLIDNDINDADSRAVLQKAMLLLIAVALNTVELAIPRLPFFPWLKPGFANIITVLWIIRYGFRDAMLFTALRVWIAGFYFGFSLFTFSLGIAGGLLSTAVMSALWLSLGKRKIAGTVGMAVIGALFHNAGQLAIVYFMMSGNASVLGQIPFMLIASVVFGGLVGMLVPTVAGIVNINGIDTDIAVNDVHQPKTSTSTDKFVVTLTFAVSIALMFVNNLYVLTAAAFLFSLTALILNPQKIAVILYPLRFYMLFMFVAVTHLFFSYGARIEQIPFITKEGLSAFVKQSLRLWCWLQTIHIFKKFNFDTMFINALRRFFPNRQDTLNAGMIALKHFPEMIRFAKSNGKIKITEIFLRPKTVLSEYVKDVGNRISRIITGLDRA